MKDVTGYFFGYKGQKQRLSLWFNKNEKLVQYWAFVNDYLWRVFYLTGGFVVIRFGLYRINIGYANFSSFHLVVLFMITDDIVSRFWARK